jgi:3-deoxy-D-manno-octulosonic-acid transferase
LHLIFYNVFLLLYTLAIRIAAGWNVKAQRWVNGRKELWSQLEVLQQRGPGKLVWMHCASLGEFEQGRPLIEAIRRHYPNTRILITFFSPSGYEIRKNYEGADWVFYLPMDSPKAAPRFIDMVKPDLVLWVKYEYWYYFLVTLKKRQIPTLLVSGIFRHNQPFFKWYGRLHRYMLESFHHMFVQSERSKELLASIGFTANITVSGDTRFDRVATIAANAAPIPIAEAFCGQHPVIVAGSTWLEDEEELDHYANTHPEIRFIIAPHEISEERLREVESLFRRSVRYSTLRDGSYQQSRGNDVSDDAPPNVLIIDNIGMLSTLYRYATITYVGGGFGEDGVHNVLEAAVYGKPVVFGPEYSKYAEAVDLVKLGAAFSVPYALELEQVFNRLLQDAAHYQQCCEAAANYVRENCGATATIMQYIREKNLLTS